MSSDVLKFHEHFLEDFFDDLSDSSPYMYKEVIGYRLEEMNKINFA